MAVANSEHLVILGQGVNEWNQWRRNHPEIIPDLSQAKLRYATLRAADLSNCRLSQADLHKAKLSYANLRNADLSGCHLDQADLHNAKLSQANLQKAKLIKAHLFEVNFYAADLRDADLREADLRDTDLREADLRQADLQSANLYKSRLSRANLQAANLLGANLRDADLVEANLHASDFRTANLRAATLRAADLTQANFSRANLSHANLSSVQAQHTVFHQIILTGACIESWNINNATNLEGVQCDYIFLACQNGQFAQRRPFATNSNFASGEFDSLISKTQKMIDLRFVIGFDWKAFFQAFQELQSKYADHPISIQCIERKTDGLIIRLVVDAEVDQVSIETTAKALYDFQLRRLNAQYEECLHLKGMSFQEAMQSIEAERRDKSTLLGVISTLATHQQGPEYTPKASEADGQVAETVADKNGGGTQ
ncbi:MAG: pentapeptide repeat-containing protein [Leptolyngbyaceae cyanobacterium MO_188.B28]|nr:pentapeptide repeat-containing protein [Leptolyngbyaceae cyanobacterium MO_188.B28]